MSTQPYAPLNGVSVTSYGAVQPMNVETPQPQQQQTCCTTKVKVASAVAFVAIAVFFAFMVWKLIEECGSGQVLKEFDGGCKCINATMAGNYSTCMNKDPTPIRLQYFL